jgi:hypothetical protein
VTSRTRKCPGHGPSESELHYCDGSCQRPIHGQTRSDASAQIRQVPERGKVRKALFELFAEWETQVSADRSGLRYAPLADKADAFIDAMVGYVEHQRTADSPAWLARNRGATERIEVGTDGCGCPITEEITANGLSVEGTERVEHRPKCWNAAQHKSGRDSGVTIRDFRCTTHGQRGCSECSTAHVIDK